MQKKSNKSLKINYYSVIIHTLIILVLKCLHVFIITYVGHDDVKIFPYQLRFSLRYYLSSLVLIICDHYINIRYLKILRCDRRFKGTLHVQHDKEFGVISQTWRLNWTECRLAVIFTNYLYEIIAHTFSIFSVFSFFTIFIYTCLCFLHRSITEKPSA